MQSSPGDPRKKAAQKSLSALFGAALVFLLPLPGSAETYKYKDENGALHFADSLDKIPIPYRKSTEVLPELKPAPKTERKPLGSVPEKSLIGRWEYQGTVNGNSYTLIMSLRDKGAFDGNGIKKMGEKTLVWMFKGNWRVLEGNLVLTYTWSSAPEPKRGTSQSDAVLEVNDQFLEVKSGRTGEIVRYTRK